jgi:hypothetical protein
MATSHLVEGIGSDAFAAGGDTGGDKGIGGDFFAGGGDAFAGGGEGIGGDTFATGGDTFTAGGDTFTGDALAGGGDDFAGGGDAFVAWTGDGAALGNQDESQPTAPEPSVAAGDSFAEIFT